VSKFETKDLRERFKLTVFWVEYSYMPVACECKDLYYVVTV